ncbi:MAG: hypothetical protein M1587_00985 [Thaumarchaeota archaeon]|nr:hypothetical protein [Nitrososphaerota archaeon]
MKGLISITAVTLICIRGLAVLAYSFSNHGTAFFWSNPLLDAFDHYQLGLVLLFASIFYKRRRTLIVGIGAGLVIDEANKMLNVLSFGRVPFSFDSELNYVLSIMGFLVFSLVVVLAGKFKEHSMTSQKRYDEDDVA